MAVPPKWTVLLLSLCTSVTDELYLQRRLINLTALLRDPRIEVDYQIHYGTDWLQCVKSVLGEGDMILCPAEQEVGWQHKPLTMVLSQLPVPIWTLAGSSQPNVVPPRPHWLSTVGFWTGSLAILGGFFYVHSRIVLMPDELTKNITLGLSFLVELGSLYLWNLLFS
jgi:hypothetical protein